jgi:phosphoribosylanthranilate isomerase
MLDLVSFVGVDKSTTQESLHKYSRLLDQLNLIHHTFNVELGFLYSEGRAGLQPRYPDFQFIDDSLYSLCYSPFRTSIHLCGKEAIDKFFNKDTKLLEVCALANRVQLNMNMDSYDVNELVDKITEMSKDFTLIIQDNKSKKELVDSLNKLIPFKSDLSNVNFLYDASGGIGREIKDVKPVHKLNYTGYAGGINPYNVLDILKTIQYHNDTGASYYIDMESGIRTDDKFDVNKCIDITLNLFHHLNYRNNL